MPTLAVDGEEFGVQSNGGDWLIAWHPPTTPPAGQPHGANGWCLADCGGIVLISNDGERWGWPGGRPEGSESWEETFRREMLEEACVVVGEAERLGFCRARCVSGPEAGLVLVRSIWRADADLLPWEPRHEIPYRRVVPASQLRQELVDGTGLRAIVRTSPDGGRTGMRSSVRVRANSALEPTAAGEMQNKGLIFIPDISGFSRFVTETEIEHSRLIIQELLETLLNANNTGLEISEIEGDAILFYRFGDLPDLRDLYKQVERMFCAFHMNLLAYDLRRYCQCEACVSAISLTLKVITHYGEFTGYNVKTFNKLIGKDIIVAHELLKNEIADHEYWLVTQNLVRDGRADAFAPWMEWNTGAKQTQGGTVSFQYTPLSQLKNDVAAEPIPHTELTDKVKVISLSREYETDIITLFHATGDFSYRARWQEGVKRVEEVDHLLPRVGMRCRCVLEHGEAMTYSNSYRYQSDRIEFSETGEQRKSVMRFILQVVDPNTTRLTLEYHLAKGLPGQVLFRLMRKAKMERALENSLQNLVGLVKEILIPGKVAAP